MNIIFNPLDNKALTEDQLKGNDDIIFDLRGHNIFAKGVKFYGTDTHDWDNIINAPDKLPNPNLLTIFDVSYDGSEPVTITPNNYICKVAKANITTNPITDKMAFIGTYSDPSTYVESVNNTPLRYSISDVWDSWLKPKIDNWYETQSSKVNATLWGNKFTGTENISNSIYLSAGSQIFVKNTEILDYSNGSLYVGYGTRLKNNTTYIYGGNSITLLTKGTSDISKSFKMTLANINTDLPIYANDTMNIAKGLYLSSHIIGKLNNSTQSYTDPWQDSKADFRFGGSLAATKIYASQGFYCPVDSTTGDTYLLTADGGTTTVKDIRSAIQVKQDNNHGDFYPLIWTNEVNADSKNDSHLYKSYDKLTFNPSTISLTIGSSNNPITHRWIEGMTRAAINTYSNGYRAWISGSTSSGRLSIGSFGNNTSGTDGNIYFSYATKDNISNGINDVFSNIWINPKTNIINSTHYSGYSYTATGGYHLQKNGSDVVAGLIATDGDYYQTTNTTYYGKHPWGCIPVITNAGGMEIGKYIDFHNDNNERDYSTRLYTDGNYGNNVLMPNKNGRLLVESDLDNVKSMYEVVVNLHPSNYVLNSNNEYVPGFSYSENTWYPVEIQLFTVGKCDYPVIRGEILQYLDCGYTNSQGTRVSTGSGNCSWMTHQHGFSTRIVFESQASGQGTTPNNILRVMDANQTWCVVNPVRNMVQDYKSSSIVVWCRGYGEYRFRFNYPSVGVIVHNSSFSLGDPGNSNLYETYTFSSAINNTADPSWNEIWNDLNGKLPEIKPTLGYWANVAVSNASNENTAPTFYTVWAQNMFRSRGDSGWYNETYGDGIVMRQSNWIETWAGANIYTSGAMSASKLLIGFSKNNNDTNYDLYILNTHGSKFNGTINTTFGAILTNKPSIDFRGGIGIGTWTSWCHHESSGNEALLFATENIDTTIMFANNIKQSTITNSLFQSITAPLRIQQNKVWMGYGYKANSLSDYILNVNGDAEINGNLYTKNINHCDKNNGFLIIGDKTRELSIRSSRNPDISALYLNYKLGSNVCFSANYGFCITPYYLSQHQEDTVTISGNKYILTNIRVYDTQTISCIIASKCFILPNQGTVRGQLIRFVPTNDGQIVLLKYLYTYGNGTAPTLYVQPMNCSIVPANDSDAYIANGTISDAYSDGRSRFFIYSATHNVWIEFYCG